MVLWLAMNIQPHANFFLCMFLSYMQTKTSMDFGTTYDHFTFLGFSCVLDLLRGDF